MAIVVPIVSEWNPKGLERAAADISGMESRLGKAGAIAQKAALPAAAVLTGLGAGALYAADQASKLEQATGALTAVFGPQTDEMTRAAEAAQKIGLSQADYSQSAAVLGAQLGALGIQQDDLAPTTQRLIDLAADLAAQYGGTTADAVSALGALMRGEAEPAERLGIAITAADVAARMAANGLDGLTGEAAKAAEAQTRLELVYEQTTSAQGAAARETDTLASRQQQLSAQVDNISAKLGEALLPHLESLADKGATALDWVEENEGTVATLVVALGSLAAAVLAVNAAMKVATAASALAAAYQVLTGATVANTLATWANQAAWLARQIGAGVAFLLAAAAAITASTAAWIANTVATLANRAANLAAAAAMTVVRGAVLAWTAAQWALNAAMAANPIGLVVVAIAALIAAVILAYQNVDWFRAGVDAAWQGIQRAIEAVVGWFTGTAVPAIQAYINDLKRGWDTLTAVVRAAWQGIQNAIAAVANWWDGVAANIGNAAQSMGGVFTAVKDTVVGAWNGMKNAIGSVADWIQGKLSWLQGTVSTITGLASTVTGAIGGIFGAGDAAVSSRAANTTAMPAPVNITVQGALDPDAVARQVVGLVRSYQARTGLPPAAVLTVA